MASFIRQLNMYGFRKVVHIEQGGLVKPEKDDTEFQHQFFIRGQEGLLDNIKRKVTTVASVRQDEAKMAADDVHRILNDVQLIKGKQETIDSRISSMKHENEALWREVASLRQKHLQQQKVVNKLIQFLVSLVQSNRIMGVKRKIPLMLSDSSSAHSMPKYSRQLSLEHMQAAANLLSADSLVTSGPIVSDITEVVTPTAESVISDWMDEGDSQSVQVKEEPLSPVLEVGDTPVDTPLSPTTFINSILQENDTQMPPSTDPAAVSPIVVMDPSPAGPLPTDTPSQSPASNPTPNSAPCPSKQQSCQTIACIDRPRPPPSAGGLSPDVWRVVPTRTDISELSNHVDCIDSSLENLQSLLNNQTFTFDTSPLMEFFSSTGFSGDFDVDSLDNLLSDDIPNGGDDSVDTGKQLVHYMSAPILLEAEPPADDPPAALLSPAHLLSDL
ncbi:heat shock factor protein 1 isoform X1 [Etheostoma cragini]|uniref:heat shock factor protein 1 isoform X1 n=1 Tax=Etheostoma cragini TaxID=417921 RepID=UPI00155DEAEB|nr:heat shock factor protein 1 isoform X1 [Etheostoma cragini]